MKILTTLLLTATTVLASDDPRFVRDEIKNLNDRLERVERKLSETHFSIERSAPFNLRRLISPTVMRNSLFVIGAPVALVGATAIMTASVCTLTYVSLHTVDYTMGKLNCIYSMYLNRDRED